MTGLQKRLDTYLKQVADFVNQVLNKLNTNCFHNCSQNFDKLKDMIEQGLYVQKRSVCYQ